MDIIPVIWMSGDNSKVDSKMHTIGPRGIYKDPMSDVLVQPSNGYFAKGGGILLPKTTPPSPPIPIEQSHYKWR